MASCFFYNTSTSFEEIVDIFVAVLGWAQVQSHTMNHPIPFSAIVAQGACISFHQWACGIENCLDATIYLRFSIVPEHRWHRSDNTCSTSTLKRRWAGACHRLQEFKKKNNNTHRKADSGDPSEGHPQSWYDMGVCSCCYCLHTWVCACVPTMTTFAAMRLSMWYMDIVYTTPCK